MNANDMKILKCLVAMAWADGVIDSPEAKVIDELLDVFEASPDEADEIRDYAKTKRALSDVALSSLSKEDREVLLGNAAVLSHADGTQTKSERKFLADLVAKLGIPADRAQAIIEASKDGALMAGSRGLSEL